MNTAHSAQDAAKYLKKAAELNDDDPLRNGSLLEFPNYGQLVMTGDLHGHMRNFERIRNFANLEHFAARHVILHEIVHQEVEGYDAEDLSYQVLIEAAKWKCDYPDQVHFMQSNHELAQLFGDEITKNGRVVTADFENAIRQEYGDEFGPVYEGVEAYIRSLPLAGRTPNRVFLSHSLPGPREMFAFDPSVIARVPTEADLGDNGSAHMLVWGRYQTPEMLETLRESFDVDFFITGHQPQETGYDVRHDCMIILASDHNHGVFLTLDLAKPTTLDKLTSTIRPLAAIA